MPQLQTKLSRLHEMMNAGDWHAALKLAAAFPRLGEHKAAISRAWSAIQSPEIYLQMGRDPQALIDAGIAALRERYSE